MCICVYLWTKEKSIIFSSLPGERMIKSNLKLITAAALLTGAVSFGACSATSTNTVSTSNTNAAGTANTANTNKATNAAPTNAAPSNSAVQPANTTSESRPPVKKDEMLSADTASTGEKTGVPECDEYIAKYEACVTTKIPEAQRATFTASLEEMKKNWKSAADSPQAKTALAGGCKQASTAAKQSMGAFSCSW